MYLILTPAVSCKKNRMSEMAAEILVDTKQQLKKNTQRSLQYRFQAIVEREATLKIWITPKKFVFQNGAYLLLCRNANVGTQVHLFIPHLQTVFHWLIIETWRLEHSWHSTTAVIMPFVVYIMLQYRLCHFAIYSIHQKNYALLIGWKRLHFFM